MFKEEDIQGQGRMVNDKEVIHNFHLLVKFLWERVKEYLYLRIDSLTTRGKGWSYLETCPTVAF